MFTKEAKAKGLKYINTFIIIYLKEYEIAKFKRPIDIKLLERPEIVNISKDEFPKYIVEFISCIKVIRQMFLSKIISPTSLIASDKVEVRLIIISTINKAEFIEIAHKKQIKH